MIGGLPLFIGCFRTGGGLAGRYRGMTATQMDQAVRSVVDPSRFVWVVVGDASVVRPQLEGLGLPIEVVQPN